MSSSTTEQGLVDVAMPQMGTSMSEGTIVAWLKSVGDPVATEEMICEISTDKIDTECPSPAAGTLVEILVGVEETVEVGTVLARIAPAGVEAAAAEVAAEAVRNSKVVDAVSHTTAQVAMTANEHASSSEEVTAAAEEQSASTEEMASSASELLQGANRLTDLVSAFKT